MQDKHRKATVLVAALGFITAAQAHHSNAIFDFTKTVSVTGTLRSVEFINPHSQFVLDVVDAGGKTVEWHFESQPPAWFSKAGIKKADFTKGVDQKVTVTGVIARNGVPQGILSKMTFEDGSSVAFATAKN